MRLFEFGRNTQQALLYHGTLDRDIEILNPRRSDLVRDDVIFAATFLDVAVAMTGHWTDDDFDFGRRGQEQRGEMVRYRLRELRSGAFEQFFSDPVYVYLVPSDGFVPHDSIQDFELVNTNSVEPLSYVTISDPKAFLETSPVVEIINFD